MRFGLFGRGELRLDGRELDHPSYDCLALPLTSAFFSITARDCS
jgi:hypothetical protein